MEIPGLDLEVYFGDTEAPPVDWRKVLGDQEEQEDEEITPEYREWMLGIVGIDPFKRPRRVRKRRRKNPS